MRKKVGRDKQRTIQGAQSLTLGYLRDGNPLPFWPRVKEQKVRELRDEKGEHLKGQVERRKEHKEGLTRG